MSLIYIRLKVIKDIHTLVSPAQCGWLLYVYGDLDRLCGKASLSPFVSNVQVNSDIQSSRVHYHTTPVMNIPVVIPELLRNNSDLQACHVHRNP